MITYYVKFEDGSTTTKEVELHSQFLQWSMEQEKRILDCDYEETD